MLTNPERFDEWRPAGFDGLFEWDFLRGAFGPTIQPMDFDAVVERNRHLLVYETKDVGKDVPDGQRRALEAAIQLPKSRGVSRDYDSDRSGTLEGR